MKMGRPPLHNWKEIANELEASGKSLKVYCEEKGLSYTYASKELGELEREDAERSLALAKRRLARNAPQAAQTLVDLLYSEQEDIKLKAVGNLLDRVGLSAAAINLQVTNNNTMNFISAPIFAQAAEPLMNQLLGEKE